VTKSETQPAVAVTVLAVGPFDNRVYVISNPETKKAVVIDAANEADRVLEACRGLKVQSILTTHGHTDHIQAVDRVKEKLGIPFLMNLADIEIAGRKPDERLVDRQEIAIGNANLHVLHTPGHTPGSMCFVLEPMIFTGDTLFPGGPGATQWEYSSFGQIMDSIEKRLMVYPDKTVIYPGHGASTTLGDERPALPEWRRRGW
jgi:glyoxylase-like metal-dependent hydrolase (beta-lactamase superfamily II)